jgi:signal transduction histidine kinase
VIANKELLFQSEEKEKRAIEKEFDRNNLNALINNTDDLMWSVDRNFNLITSNQPFNEFVKVYSGEIIKNGDSVLSSKFTSEQSVQFKNFYMRAFDGDTFSEIIYDLMPEESWSDISYSPIRKGDEVIGAACQSHNITEKIKAERQLKYSESFNRGVLNSLSSHIAVIDNLGNIVAVNESWKRFAIENGVTVLQGSGVGSNYFEVCEKSAKAGEEVANEAIEGIKDVINEKIPVFYFEYACHSPTHQRWFGVRVMKFDSDDQMVVISHQNISERRLAEANLLQSESSLKEAQAIAHLGNFEIDMVHYTEIWSDQMYKILGVEKTVDPSKESFASFIHPDDLNASRKAFKSLKNDSMDYRLIRKDGTITYVSSEWRFKFDEANKPLRLYGVLQDITERKLAEMERIKMVNELMLRNNDLEQFAYIISHNLRAPVANIIGASRALNDIGLDIEDKEILSRGINTSIMKLDEVVKDLNQILQVKGKINDIKEIVRFSDLVDDIKISIKNLLDKDDIEIKYDFAEVNELLTLKPYLYSIFFNLISNSAKYRRQHIHSFIKIKSRLQNNKAKLIFTDNGMGINLKKSGNHVFGLYKRFHNDNIEGKGMGLFMVKTQVETLGGKISIKSTENKGTEFSIEFET